MLVTFEAVFEEGVLKPLADLGLGEHERVRLHMQSRTPLEAVDAYAGILKLNVPVHEAEAIARMSLQDEADLDE